MNLQKLFELQRKLDEHIEREHPRQEGEDRLAKKILALQVELGELCQEWRGFKFWSNDQKPRRAVYEICEYCEGRKTLGFQLESCWYCGGTGLQVVKRPLLEEYVDCLHFILSIGLEIGFTEEPTGIIREYDVIHQFNKMFYMIGEFYDFYIRYGKGCGLYDMFDDLFGYFLGLGKMLGFSWEEIKEAYLRKNAINHERQNNNY
jgi:dimeric dUTPase (all-alpha-NTP-PPase superfamily)